MCLLESYKAAVQLRRVSTKVFQVQCVTDCHHRCPPAGPRQKNFRNHPSHATTCRHDRAIFGTVRVSSARSKAAIGKPLICIGLAGNGRGKFGGWFGAKGEGVWPTKKALQILHL
jgi:hypothetical protein